MNKQCDTHGHVSPLMIFVSVLFSLRCFIVPIFFIIKIKKDIDQESPEQLVIVSKVVQIGVVIDSVLALIQVKKENGLQIKDTLNVRK